MFRQSSQRIVPPAVGLPNSGPQLFRWNHVANLVHYQYSNHHIIDYDSDPTLWPRFYDVPVTGISRLGRSLFGICLKREPVRPALAYIFLNAYPGWRWDPNKPKSGNNDMSLPGSEVDEQTMHVGLVKRIPGVQVEIVMGASSDDIHERMTKPNEPAPDSCWYYFQGHGKRWMYLPSDSRYEDESWEGLDSDEFCHTLGSMDSSAWRVFVTDFCRSGNYIRLRYMLLIEGINVRWVETPEWAAHKDECPAYARAHNTPTIHFAGSTDKEETYEGKHCGGFFTRALVNSWDQPFTLPNLLRAIRKSVSESLDAAKKGGAKFGTQTPQIYSSVELSLEDTQVLAKFQRGGS